MRRTTNLDSLSVGLSLHNHTLPAHTSVIPNFKLLAAHEFLKLQNQYQ